MPNIFHGIEGNQYEPKRTERNQKEPIGTKRNQKELMVTSFQRPVENGLKGEYNSFQSRALNVINCENLNSERSSCLKLKKLSTIFLYQIPFSLRFGMHLEMHIYYTHDILSMLSLYHVS